MLAFALSLLATLLHGAAMLAGAPLLTGIINKVAARLAGRRAAPVLQPYRNLAGHLRKTPAIPDTATGFFAIWPYAGFAATAAAALLVPSFATGMLAAPEGDLVTFIGLMFLGRATVWLAGLETGFAAAGAAAARDLLVHSFAIATWLLVALTLTLIAHDPRIDAMVHSVRHNAGAVTAPLGLALAAMLAGMLAETGWLTGNPASGASRHPMLTEYSGRYLLMFEYTAMLRLMIWLSLLAAIFCPFGMADAGAILAWPGGIICWVAKLAVLAAGLALFETGVARPKLFRAPKILGFAALLGALSAIFLLAVRQGGG